MQDLRDKLRAAQNRERDLHQHLLFHLQGVRICSSQTVLSAHPQYMFATCTYPCLVVFVAAWLVSALIYPFGPQEKRLKMERVWRCYQTSGVNAEQKEYHHRALPCIHVSHNSLPHGSDTSTDSTGGVVCSMLKPSVLFEIFPASSLKSRRGYDSTLIVS